MPGQRKVLETGVEVVAFHAPTMRNIDSRFARAGGTGKVSLVKIVQHGVATPKDDQNRAVGDSTLIIACTSVTSVCTSCRASKRIEAKTVGNFAVETIIKAFPSNYRKQNFLMYHASTSIVRY